jgi:hypothetical protein
MTVILLPYNSSHYDTLPDIMDAGKRLESSGVLESLDASVGSIFVKHGLANQFGLILLHHNHFRMSPTEKLVSFGNAAIPCDDIRGSKASQYFRGASWRFTPEGLAPFEFIYAPPSNASIPNLSVDSHHQNFLVDLGKILEEPKLIDMFGLCVLGPRDIDSPPTFEIASGRANITLDVSSHGEEGGSIQTIWKFGGKGERLLISVRVLVINTGLADPISVRQMCVLVWDTINGEITGARFHPDPSQ